MKYTREMLIDIGNLAIAARQLHMSTTDKETIFSSDYHEGYIAGIRTMLAAIKSSKET